ncbi:MAG: DEAD/DEAH box helicase [Pseudomonadales bacterium]|nr:DEAD/DEAH box helicase [Pseudomonadales bacterium]
MSDVAATHAALEPFHPSVRDWFSRHHAAPTDVQCQAWPAIARGDNVLATAPTGSGKTLTAFLWALNRFAAGTWKTGATRVLYISPLKALNNDIRANLLGPLNALHADYHLPRVTVGVRSGDTTPTDRQRMLRHPPDILITTPESLHLLLTTVRGRAALATVECLIVDEVHALVDNRRGVQLAVCMERLADIAGEFQRIALSATVNPLDAVAEWVGGADAGDRVRPVTILAAPGNKQIDLKVSFPPEARNAAEAGRKIWEPLGEKFKDIISHNRSTLFFTNSRRLAEKITLRINEGEHSPVAYAHHGSLAKDIRTEVEQRLKGGELKAIVATSSLEMGIDIGALDEVVMVQSPPSIAQAMQRIGRAGHQVNAVSRGTLFPSHNRDMVDAAVLTEAIAGRALEPIHLMRGPLDILVQIIVSMSATETVAIDAVYATLTRALPYRDLDRHVFDLVVDMLSGRFSGTRIRELKPRITVDRLEGTLSAAKGALHAMYTSGGSIPDRGYYTLRAMEGVPIGELDEEFVWEATIGQQFTLGTQAWRIERITHNDVFVSHARAGDAPTPFWRSETLLRGNFFSDRIGRFLAEADAALEQGDKDALGARLTADGFDDGAVEALIDYLERQRRSTGAPLPGRYHLLVEMAAGGPGGYRGPDAPKQLILHTTWGGALNQPYALALNAALRRQGWKKPEIHVDNDSVVVQCHDWPDAATVLGLVTPDNLDTLLRETLENSGHFGARFREAAGRSLLLAKPRFNQRLPLWMSRLQAKKLMTQVKKFHDFPVLLETWRTCLQDEFDLPALRERLTELADGVIQWQCVATEAPSPFAASVAFDQINPFMYATDDPEEEALSNLSDELIAGAVQHAHLRPRLSADVVAEFEAKRQRLHPEYSPSEVDDVVDWLRERVLVPDSEWQRLETITGIPTPAHPAIARIAHGDRQWLTHSDYLPVFLGVQGVQQVGKRMPAAAADPALSLEQLCVEVLSFYGPLARGQIDTLLPDVPATLLTRDDVVDEVLLEADDTPRWCERETLEILFRLQRARRRANPEPLPFQRLPGFLANLHGLHRAPPVERAAQTQAIGNSLAQLSGFAAPVAVWLNDLIPARLGDDTTRGLATAMTTEGFCWRGRGRERVFVSTTDEAPLFQDDAAVLDAGIETAFRDPSARYAFNQIRDALDSPLDELNDAWWQAVWSGRLAADDWSVLQQAAERKFRLPGASPTRSPAGLRRRARASAVGWPGHWQLVQHSPSTSPIDRLEDARARMRILFDRYGILCRELVVREGLGWSAAFRALRTMELAGEIVGGHFVTGLGGPQFIAPAALQRLLHKPTAPDFWWVNAVDCVSPCGLGLDWPELPPRRASNYLAFHGDELGLVVENGGKHLRFLLAATDNAVDGVLAVLTHLCGISGRVAVERINGDSPLLSAYLPALQRVLRVHNDHKGLEIEAA